MVFTVHDLDTACPPCPQCVNILREASDMWGVFYSCDKCGFEAEVLGAGLEANHSRQLLLVRQEAIAGVG